MNDPHVATERQAALEQSSPEPARATRRLFWYHVAFWYEVGPMAGMMSATIARPRAITMAEDLQGIAQNLLNMIGAKALDEKGTPIIGAPEPPKRVSIVTWTLMRIAKE